ncbi:hypothetical protein SG34_032915 [Thalassomonas viridans]|uniref:Uncharacterized protein n=1 Tax=Thalassomonas viridans TaxID=137584 RepID=A0AAE9Z9Q6_9GAMM|nr:hypothetical protein [Thalassomonas viridans]WDE08709.1 hypothetical protein SG34_032915 [Thalassomonas viridans]
MAKPNDMPEFHSVKVYLTENIPAPLPGLIAKFILKLTLKLIPRHKQPPAANAADTSGSNLSCGRVLLTSLIHPRNTGGRCHV